MVQIRCYQDQIDRHGQTDFVGCKYPFEVVILGLDLSAFHPSPALIGIEKSLSETSRCLLLTVRNTKTALWRIIIRLLLVHQDCLLTFEIHHLTTNSKYLTETKV